LKTFKIAVTLLLVYAMVVAAFEFTLGYFQPEDESTFVITTNDADGRSSDRVLVQNFSGGQLYAAANHWPRAWYYEAIENPKILVTIDGATTEYLATPISAEEHERVNRDNANGIGLMILFGFAPRAFLRLDPA